MGYRRMELPWTGMRAGRARSHDITRFMGLEAIGGHVIKRYEEKMASETTLSYTSLWLIRYMYFVHHYCMHCMYVCILALFVRDSGSWSS